VREQLQYICFKSIFINHKMTCDTVTKRHFCPLMKGQGGNAPVIPPLSGVPAEMKRLGKSLWR